MTHQDTTFGMPYKAVIFDIYGTLLDAPRGGVCPDPSADPLLRRILETGNWRRGINIHLPDCVLQSPSTALHQAVKAHHTQSTHPHPEVDLRTLWKQLLDLPNAIDAGQLVIELHSAWNPATWIDGCRSALQRASRNGRLLGLLSNAQYDTLDTLRPILADFQPDLVLLSFEQGVAKPSPSLFLEMKARLAARQIPPEEVLFVGNHLTQDIVPARQVGFNTLLFQRQASHPCQPGVSPGETFSDWHDFDPDP